MTVVRSDRLIPAALAGLLALAGCATPPAANAPRAPDAATARVTPPAGSASAPAAPGAPLPATPSGPLRPFAEIVKDAKRIDGLFTLWQKDDKFWLELKPDDFDRPFFLSPKFKTGIGEPRFYGGLMGEEAVIEFRRVHNQLQMLARNTSFVAAPNTPTGRAVDVGFSPSLLASTAVLSQPHPERKSVLVEANPLFINDMLGTALALQRSYRQGYTLDARNSAITAVRGSRELLVVEVLSHFATGTIAVPQPGTPPGAPVPSVPRTVPDPRSLFMTLHYSLAPMPATVMAPRKADARVGYFTAGLTDFSDDLTRSPRQRFVQRGRLEKKEPGSPLSDPVKPIVFWLDRTIPEKYRAPITAGVLEWNKAFEAIGFRGAIQVRTQPDDADWDTLDFGHASIRWMTSATSPFVAVGPSQVDPRSGEILDADIVIDGQSFRSLRALRGEVIGLGNEPGHAHQAAGPGGRYDACEFADQAAEQLGYGLDVLEARGDLDPTSPEVEKFVADYLRMTTMHEVGHTLGLRHNFRSSRIYTDQQLASRAFTETHALTGSVMDYAPINLAAPGVPAAVQALPFSTTLGPYDYWAIDYAYRPIEPAAEAATLAQIAGRSAEPELAYGTDEDNFIGIDPESLQFDLGSDAVAFARRRVEIGRDLLARQETRTLEKGTDYAVLRRSVTFALRDMGRAAGVLARQIGGVRTLRDHAGTGRDPLQPVPAAEQRAALSLLTSGFLAADSFNISPALQRRLALDFQERTDAVFSGEALAATDFSLAALVIELQRGVLGAVLSDSVAARLLDSEQKSPKDALRLAELYQRLDQAVWSELGAGGGDIPAARRELQREHVNRIASVLLRPGSLSRADARSLLRAQAQALLAKIQAAERRPGLGAEACAHLADSADTLAQAAARPVRGGA